jgi:hypothetical protein
LNRLLGHAEQVIHGVNLCGAEATSGLDAKCIVQNLSNEVMVKELPASEGRLDPNAEDG